MSAMADRNIEKDLRLLVVQILEIDADKVTLDAKFVDDLGMDSMMALEIMASAEKKFKIAIPEDQLTKVTDLKSLVDIVGRIAEGK